MPTCTSHGLAMAQQDGLLASRCGRPRHHEMELDAAPPHNAWTAPLRACSVSTATAAPPRWPASASPDRDVTPGSRHHRPAAGRRHQQRLPVPHIGFARPSASDSPLRGCTPHAPRVVAAPPRIAPPPFAPVWSPTSQWAWLAVGEE